MTEIIITPVLFLTIGFVFWVLISEIGRRSRFKMLTEFRMRMLDRLTSASDIVAVLEGDEGAMLLRDVDAASSAGFHARVLLPVQVGIVFVFVAAGFAALALLGSFGASEVFGALAIMCGFVGGGFLAAALAAWRLGLQSGLIPKAAPPMR